MLYEIPITKARDELADLINRAAYGHERIMLTRHGKTVAGLVPPEDLAWLEQQGETRHGQRLAILTSSGDAHELQQPVSPPEILPVAAQHQFGRKPEPPQPGR